jgi:hypothetical protein
MATTSRNRRKTASADAPPTSTGPESDPVRAPVEPTESATTPARRRTSRARAAAARDDAALPPPAPPAPPAPESTKPPKPRARRPSRSRQPTTAVEPAAVTPVEEAPAAPAPAAAPKASRPAVEPKPTAAKTAAKRARKATARTGTAAEAPPAPAPKRRRPAKPRPVAQAEAVPVPAPAEMPAAAASIAIVAGPAGSPEQHAPRVAPATVDPAPDNRPPRSAVRLFERDALRHLVWQSGRGCPVELDELASTCMGGANGEPAAPVSVDVLPRLAQLAKQHGHPLDIDDAVWMYSADERDSRWRLQQLEAACPQGCRSDALQTMLHATLLPDFQAEGALFAVVAGRALIADDRGLGKRVQAVAAAALWRQHFGLRRVLVLCHATQKADWAHEWRRLAGHTLTTPPVVVQGPLHERAALWAAASEVRILDPDTLAQDETHLRSWEPELVIVDEPQRLPGWQVADAPQALVLCGAPLAESPLLEEIIGWLDRHRRGALHALYRIQAAHDKGQALDDVQLQHLDDALSRVMLQRLRSEVQAQLPQQVHTSRLVTLGPAAREAHNRLLRELQLAIERWLASGFLGDAVQWQLAALPARLSDACHRVQPGDAHSPLAAPTVAALQAQLDDWAARTPVEIAIACANAADRAQLAAQLAVPESACWVVGDEPLPQQAEVVLGVGAPWRLPEVSAPAVPGRQWVHVVAEHSLELALCDTLASRHDLPLWDAAQGFRHGSALHSWMMAWQQALHELGRC